MSRASYGVLAVLGTAWLILLLTAVLGSGDEALSQFPVMGVITVVTVVMHLRGRAGTPGGEGRPRAGLRMAVLTVVALSCLIALTVSAAVGEIALAVPPVLLALVTFLAWRRAR